MSRSEPRLLNFSSVSSCLSAICNQPAFDAKRGWWERREQSKEKGRASEDGVGGGCVLLPGYASVLLEHIAPWFARFCLLNLFPNFGQHLTGNNEHPIFPQCFVALQMNDAS